MLSWLGVATLVGVGLLAEGATRGPLDDADPVWQRPGLLVLEERARPAPTSADGMWRPGRKSVLFFVRDTQRDDLLAALRSSEFGPGVYVAVVGPGELPGLAGELQLRRPRDGGFPVGYVIVDRAGRIRYATLDPGVADRLREVKAMVSAVP